MGDPLRPTPAPEAPPGNLEESLTASAIANRATRGALTYVARVGVTQTLQVVSALVLARALLPAEYGVFALALTLVGGARFFGDLGIEFLLAVQRRVDDQQLRIGLAVALLVGAAGYVLICVTWVFLPVVRDAPRGSVLVGPVLAATLLINALRMPATVLLHRGLAFSLLGAVTIIETVLLFGTQIALLLAGAGLWSLVVAQLVGSIAGTVGLVLASGRWLTPSLRGPVKSLVRRGLPFQATLITTGIAGTLIPVLVASLLGARGVGLFAWATILTTPIIAVVGALHSVASPSLARMLRDDPGRFDEAAGVVLATIVSLSAAAAGCLVGVAPDVVWTVFGEQWSPASTAVQLALLGMVPTAIVFALASVSDAQNQPRKRLLATIAGAVAGVLASVPLALAWGVSGAALGAYVIGPAVSAVALARQVRLSRSFPFARPALLLVLLAAGSLLVGHLVQDAGELLIGGAALAAATAVLLAVVEPQLVRRISSQVRGGGAPA